MSKLSLAVLMHMLRCVCGADACPGAALWQQAHPALPAQPALLGGLVRRPPKPTGALHQGTAAPHSGPFVSASGSFASAFQPRCCCQWLALPYTPHKATATSFQLSCNQYPVPGNITFTCPVISNPFLVTSTSSKDRIAATYGVTHNCILANLSPC